MNLWEQKKKQDIEKAMEQIEVPASLFTFAKELPYRMELTTASSPDKQAGEKDDQQSGSNPISPLLRRKKKMKWQRVAVATVATLALSVSVGAMVSPTFADYIKSLFDRPALDQGLQTAAKQGFSQETQAAVTDQGITLSVKEVLADSNRLIFTYELKNEKGETIDPVSIFEKETWNNQDYYYMQDKDLITITDEAGNLASTETNYQTQSGRMVTQSFRKVLPHSPYADLTFRLNENLGKKKLFVNIELNEINSVKGTWKLKVPVDLDKSIAATNTLPIQQEYTTPDGLKIELQNVTFSPTATSFDIKSEWTAEGKKKMEGHQEFFLPNNMYSYHGVHYQIVDEQGNILGTTQPTKAAPKDLLPVSQRSEDDLEKGEKTVWHHSFAPFDGSKKLFFKLTGIERVEYPKKQFELDPKTLKEKPVTLEYKGNSYTFKDFTLDKGAKTGLLEVEQLVPGMGGSFRLHDKTGKEYKEVTGNDQFKWEHVDEKLNKLMIKIPYTGFTEVPEKLILTLDVTGVYYDNVDWKVEIPTKK